MHAYKIKVLGSTEAVVLTDCKLCQPDIEKLEGFFVDVLNETSAHVNCHYLGSNFLASENRVG